MRRATERLAARAGCRQVEAALRADRAAAAAERAGAALWRRVLSAIAARDARGVADLLEALPGMLRRAVAGELAATAAWGHRTARRALAGEVPRAVLRALAVCRLGHHPHRQLRESFDWLDLLAPLRGILGNVSLSNILDLLFPAPSPERIERVVYAGDWQTRIRAGSGLADPAAVAQRVATGLALGRTQQQIARDIRPAVQGSLSAARRIARTESMRVAGAVQMDAHASLGDLVVGYQVHATLDERTRPEHRARDGTVYWARPRPGQLGYDAMPQPPQEADGSMAWNCRCTLSPVLAEPGPDEGAAQLQPPPSPEPLVYHDWFAKASERRRRLAVGSRRYDLVRNLSGEDAPGWEHFLDTDTGRLLGADALRGESAAERVARLAATRELLAARRADKGEVIGRGWLRQ